MRALAPTSFSLEEGEHLALVGPSGAGKSTLLRILAGLLLPTAGEVLEDGKRVNAPGGAMSPVGRRLGVLLQGLGLWPHLTARQNIELGLSRENLRGLNARERRGKVEKVLAQVGMQTLSERRPHELSGGERQRVAWARAVVGEPRLLLLDEPLTSLDPQLEAELLSLVLNFGSRPGRTFVIVTHRSDVACRVARRTLEIRSASYGIG